MGQFAYLIKVDAGANNNKFYRMIELPGTDTFKVEYGRVGRTTSDARYAMSQWDSKYREKLRKGYQDKTHLVAIEVKEDKTIKDEFAEISDNEIAKIVLQLRTLAKEVIRRNYQVSQEKVTQAMVDEAQRCLNSLIKMAQDGLSYQFFNARLTDLFEIIPRQMGCVNDYMARGANDYEKIIAREQVLLDVMATEVKVHEVKTEVEEIQEIQKDEEQKPTILEAMGLEMEPITEEDKTIILKELGDSKHLYRNAWRVKNLKTDKAFEENRKNLNSDVTKLFWHGSGSENFWSIICKGLMIRPANVHFTGTMFGEGIYFAPRAKKSIGYTSLSGSYWRRGDQRVGYMALMEVAYGKPKTTKTNSGYYDLNSRNFKTRYPGYDCVHAKAGESLVNDEVIIYNSAQCTIRYLVEIGE